MTQIERSSRKVLSGSGWANPLSHSFPLENSAHLTVISFTTVNGVADETVLQLGVDYTISGVGDDAGYSVTIVTPGDWTETEEWVLIVEPPIDQPSDVSLGGTYGARFEVALDRVANRMQSIHDMALRAVKSPLSVDPAELSQDDLVVDPDLVRDLQDTIDVVTEKAFLAAESANSASSSADSAEEAKEAAEAAASSVVIKDFDTVAAVEAATVPALANFVRVAGHSAVGDDGDGLYARVEDVPARAKYITDQGSQHFAITSRTIRDATWGLFPNTTNPHLVFKQMIDYLMLDKGGGELQLTDSDQYDTFLNSISMSAVSSGTLTIWNKNGGVLKAATGLAAPLMDLRPNNPGGAAAPQAAIFKAYDLNIDNSLGSYSGGASSATGLSLVNWDDYVLTNYRCIGGYDPNVGGTPAVGGDSGLSDTGCRHGTLINPYIAGQPDAGYYPNWDNSGDEGGYREVIGGTFYRNKNALTAKRNLSSVKFTAVDIIENDAGLTTAWVDNGGFVEPCKKLEVIGCNFIRGRANLIVAKRNTKLIAIGNTFEDPGYNPDGSNSAGANARCIRISGTTGATARGNTFRMRELPVDLQYAFSFIPDADSGVSYTGGAHNIGDNIFENWYRHSIGGTDDIPSLIGPERITSTMEANFNASDVNANSRYEYVTDTDPHIRKIRKGTTNYRQHGSGMFPRVTVDLTPLGTLTAGSTTALQTATVTGLAATDDVIIQRVSSNLVARPDIQISHRTAANAVQFYLRNSGSTDFSFVDQSIRITS